MAIMHFARAFKSTLVSKKMTCDNELKSRALIPSSLFDSINHSLVDTKHLDYVREKVYNITNKLGYVMANQYKRTRVEYIY